MKARLISRAARRLPSARKQAGAAIIEFAFVALIFLTLLIGIMELGRWLFTLNAAAEATRWGARLAVVCGSTEGKIQSHVAVMLRSGSGQIKVTYTPSACNTADCMVTVRLDGAKFKTYIPFLGGSWAIPQFPTTLPRESLGTFPEGSPPVIPTNDVCPV